MVVVQLLQDYFDLTEYEAKAYFNLCQHGPLTPVELSKKSELPRPRTYDTLKKLSQKGFAVEVENSGRYRPSNPKIILDIITTDKMKNLQKAKEELTAKLGPMYDRSLLKTAESVEISVSTGDRATMARLLKLIEDVKKEIIFVGGTMGISSSPWLDSTRHFVSRGGKIRGILDSNQIEKLTKSEKDRIKEWLEKNTEIRATELKDVFIIFDDHTTVFQISESSESFYTPNSLIIQSAEVSRSMKDYFELLWKKSEPIKL
jgi:sugar-specific transcriptional regulator TrmB